MIKINGTQIKTPHKALLNRYNLTKSGRVASGKMKMDLVAKKRTLDITYSIISGAEMKKILDLIDTNEMMFTVEYDIPDGKGKMTCYVGAIPTEYFRRGSGWYWKNVSFSLIEE